jgi:hypothetical protein
VRNNATGQKTYQFIRARMPEIDTDNLFLSTVVFLDQKTDYISSDDEMVKCISMTRKFITDVRDYKPATQINRTLTGGRLPQAPATVVQQTSVTSMMKISGLKGDPKLEFSLRRNRSAALELPFKILSYTAVPGTKDVMALVEMDFTNIPIGDYLLQATAEDLQSGKLAGKRESLTVR